MMTGWSDHLIIMPILLPLVAGDGDAADRRAPPHHQSGDRHRDDLRAAGHLDPAAAAGRCAKLRAPARAVYQLGNWPAPFGIVLVADRLSALMLAADESLGCAALAVFARALASRRASASTLCSCSC